MRLYAIGDVHGCLDALTALHREIETDLARRPVADWRIVHLGDYVDRGIDSRGVVEFLLRLASMPRVLCLRGNHDQMLQDALAGEEGAAELWLVNGGSETLESYGLSVPQFMRHRAGHLPCDAIPKAHRAFLAMLQTSARFGDYYFVHAGIDPARGLAAQEAETQLWIREPFLSCRQEFEAVIVHGHTPVRSVDPRPNRIAIDTGAVFGGPLSCLVLEGRSKGMLLAGAKVVPLTELA
jgi:serine/threonine protein phosphatase 1